MGRTAAGSAALLAVVLLPALASCSSDGSRSPVASSEPAVCASADELRTTLAGLEDVRVREDGAAAVEESWTAVQEDWAQLGDDARETHADRVDSVQTAADQVRDSLAVAQDERSTGTLADLGVAVRAFLSEAGTLLDEVGTTC